MKLYNVNYVLPSATNTADFPKVISFETSEGLYYIKAITYATINLYAGQPEDTGSNEIKGNKKFIICSQLVDELVLINSTSLANLLLNSEIFNVHNPINPPPTDAEGLPGEVG